LQTPCYVYADLGADPHDVRSIMRCFKDLFVLDLQPIQAEEIIQGALHRSSAALLIMPGGRDLPYLEKLQGIGNAQIRESVARGMRYLGFCAGAYYACDRIEFEPGTALEVVGKRELGFFPGLGRGPLSGRGTYRYDSTIGARALELCLTRDGLSLTEDPHRTSSSFHAYLNGGCAFADAHACSEVLVFAEDRTAERSAVIVGRSIGIGRALLSGVHIEYDLHHFDSSDPNLQHIIPKLKQNDRTRREVLRSLVNWLME